jgi:hypothetical protein
VALALNIGCHDIHIAGMVNVDNDAAMKPDLLLDCTKLTSKFEKNSVDFVYAGHFFEHFDVHVGKQIVIDIFTILKDYGVLVATVPDYTKCFGMKIEEAERIIIAVGTHKVLMNIDRLRDYLCCAGFKTVVQAKPSELAHCPFPNVEWQTSIIGIKHPHINFHGIA